MTENYQVVYLCERIALLLEKYIITLTFFRPIGHTGDDNHRYCGFVWFMTVGNALEGVKFTLRGVGQRLGARV